MTETEPTRRPFTPDDVARIDAALEATNGNRAHAAEMLGIDYKRLNNAVQDKPELKLKWSMKAHHAPSDRPADEIDRKPTPLAQFSPDEQKAAVAIARQDALLEHTWTKSGFTAEQRDFLKTLQKSYSLNLKSTVDLTYGGMVHTATRLLMVFEDLIGKIKDIDDHPENYERTHRTEFGENVVKSAHEYRCELYDRLIHISAEMRKVHTDVTKAQYVRAQLEALRKGSAPNSKGGFGQGTPPAAVQINLNGAKMEVAVPAASDAKSVN